MQCDRSQLLRQLRTPRARRSGFALVLVVTVMGLATMMSVAILTSSSLQAQLAGNTVRAAQAQYLAESTAEVALYYMQRPEKAPSLVGGKYPGENGMTFGSDVDASANVVVTAVSGSPDTYDVSVTAYVGPDPANQLTRTLNVRAYVPRTYAVSNGLSLVRTFIVPVNMTINGDVRCDQILTKLGTVTGSILAASSNVLFAVIPTYPTIAAPTSAQLNLVKTLTAPIPSYTYVDSNGITQTGTPQVLGAVVTGVLTPNAGNPMNVWYADSDVTMGSCTVNGTVAIVGAGHKLTISGDTHITALPGMPALVVNSDLRFPMGITSKKVIVDGLVHLGGSITTTGVLTNAGLTVNGAMMMVSPAPTVSPLFLDPIVINFNANNVKIPDLANQNKQPTSVKIVKWDF